MALTKIDDRGVTYPLDLLDNEKIRFGTGNDLEIFHTGSHSNITDSGTGNLNINASQVNIHNVAINEPCARFIENDAVKLYYDASEKLATSSTGITVTGKINPTGNIHMPDNVGIKLGASDDLVLWHYGQSGDDKNYISTGSATLRIQSTGDETQAQFIPNGACELYHDGVKTFETATSGNCHLLGDTDVRLTLGSQGTEGTNDANWIRGEGVNLMYNSASGNHTWEVGGSEKLRLQSGGGISFNGDNQAANALDDYEYGTFTPTWNTDSASVTIGYHTQKGFYVKIGRMVYFQVYIRLNSSGAVSGGSGALAVHGLPFTPQNATSSDNVAYGTANIGYTNSWSGDTADRALVSSGSAKFYVYVGQSSGTNVVAGAGNLGNDTQFRASGSYVAA